MRCISCFRQHARTGLPTLLLMFGAAAAYGADTYEPANKQLTIPSIGIGVATYSNMVVTVGNIVSGPTGNSPAGGQDSYDPRTNQLTVQTVTVGSATYYNVVVTLAGLVSIGNASGTDTYDGTDLTIPYVVDGGTIYDHVIVAEALGDVVSVAGGIPTAAPDTYSSLTNQLAIPAVQVGNKVYTNVLVTAGKLASVGGVFSTVTESILHSFSGSGAVSSLDGAGPYSLVQGSDGSLYGTTSAGGAYSEATMYNTVTLGTVFKIDTMGNETVLHSFSGTTGISGVTDGAIPNGLIQASDGNFYGTTQSGGLHNLGTVFKITSSGVETVLYSFGATSVGVPFAGLVQGSDGNFYGTTTDAAAVFKITPEGEETDLYSFPPLGVLPEASLVEGSDGNFYGTTAAGGADEAGTFFKITPAGAETDLYSFTGQPFDSNLDGQNPGGIVQGNDGSFYGTTNEGGVNNWGTIFKVTPAGVESVLYSFGPLSLGVVPQPDGAFPLGLIMGSDGSFYGMTNSGGTYSLGTLFKITPDGVKSTLYSFSGPSGVSGRVDGGIPVALILGNDGSFYGVTEGGGAHVSASSTGGTVFELTKVILAP